MIAESTLFNKLTKNFKAKKITVFSHKAMEVGGIREGGIEK
jgi:hypothetical protein